MKVNALLIAALLICGASLLRAGEEDIALVDRVLRSSPFTRGVACVPDCGPSTGSGQAGELALSLVQQSGFLVLAMDEDAEAVRRLRDKAAAAGLFGRRLYVEEGSIDSIPFADNYVDLLILDNLTDADLTDKLANEINRVLTPIHGTVLFLSPADKKQIETFANKLVEQYGLIRDKTESSTRHFSMPLAGTLLSTLYSFKLRKPELEGSDWWFHKRHDPGNNPVSKDTIFQFPPVLQYKAMPMYSAYQQATLSGNGIQVEINPWKYEKNSIRLNLCGRIFARSVYNGRILWEATTPPRVRPTRPTSVLTEDTLLIAREEQGGIVRFDALTGKELPPLEIGDEDTRVRWLAREKGVLFVLLGKPGPMLHPFFWKGQMHIEGGKDQFYGNELTAWSLKDEKELWSRNVSGMVDYRTVAVHEGRLFCYTEGQGLTCLNAADGKPVWENLQSEWPEDFKRPKAYGNMLDTSSLIVADGLIQLYLMAGGLNWKDIKSSTLVFRTEDGKLLSRMEWNTHKSMIVDGALIYWNTKFDPHTGKKIEGNNLPSPAGLNHCGLTTYAPGTGVMGHDSLNYKPCCSTGAWVAGGVLSYGPSICDCGPQQGAGAFVSGAEIIKRFKEDPEHPLVKGPAFDALASRPSPLDSSSDWSQYRGDAGHRGASPVFVGRNAKTLWMVEPDNPFVYSRLYNNHITVFNERPVPPICVGETLFTAGSDGMVKARSLKDGRELWRFCAGGPVMTSPAWHAGRLLVPGADGWIYALDADSGKLAWKRRLAPLERRILMFDQLVSTWPVLSLVAEDGTVYAAAGHTPTEGVKTFALDASTGEIRWSHVDEPDLESFHNFYVRPKRVVQGIGGSMCIVNDRVWAAGYFSFPLALDRSDGTDHQADLKHWFLRSQWIPAALLLYQRGRDLVRIDDRMLLAGGGDLLENHHVRQGKPGRTHYRLFYCNAEGDWVVDPGPRKISISYTTPACDDELLVCTGPAHQTGPRSDTTGLYAWPLADFRKAAEAMQKEPCAREDKNGQLRLNQNAFSQFEHGGAPWKKPELQVNAFVLTKDAVLAAHGMLEEHKQLPRKGRTLEDARSPRARFKGWKVTAFSRDGKETLWEVDLPQEPLFNGIAVARDGSVLVTLRDGSTVCVRGN